MIMLALAVVIAFAPTVMSSVGGSLGVFGAALVATVLLLVVHRRILPCFGVRLGSEARAQRGPVTEEPGGRRSKPAKAMR
jgi:hypothetical protein